MQNTQQTGNQDQSHHDHQNSRETHIKTFYKKYIKANIKDSSLTWQKKRNSKSKIQRENYRLGRGFGSGFGGFVGNRVEEDSGDIRDKVSSFAP